MHSTTVKRRIDRLVEDGPAELADDLYYLARHLVGGAGLDPDQEELKWVAEAPGATEAGVAACAPC
ncbi:hypothetical protein AB0C81_18700 [Streptomyces roseoverticillatus]|uniref:hypothetical protein n=1 Tax=Streptomyces roseoverticillatus TaxID=66429 RepID=UPI0033C5F36A